MPPTENSITPSDLRAAMRQPGAGVGAGIPIAVLTLDNGLTNTLAEVVTADHTIAIAPDATSLADQVVSNSAGVVLVDADAVQGDVSAVLRSLRAQFPDLVLVAAGNSAHQTRLANMITDGTVYRFLHKPVSVQRVRHFVDAALRRYDELQGVAQELRRAQAALAASNATPPKLPVKWLIGAGAAIVLAAGAWWVLDSKSPTSAPVVSTPAPAPALPPAQDKQLATLLDAADKALQANNLDEAARQLVLAAKIQPDNARLTFLSAQIVKAKERDALLQARSAAAQGDYGKAFATLDAASGGDRATLTEARRALSQQQDEERLRSLLRLGQERLARGAILDPAGDSARYYAQSARALAPRDAGSLRLLQVLQGRELQEARSAAARGDGPGTDRWLAAAREDGVTAGEIEAVRRALGDARTAQRNLEASRLAGLVRQRITQDRLIEPAEDNAQFWLEKLRALEGAEASANETAQLLGSRLLLNARTSLERGDLDDTQRWLRATESVTGRTVESSALATTLAARQEKQRKDNAVIGVGSLKRTKFVEPSYPAAAFAQKISGWVDLEFTVLKDGTVSKVQVTNAQPGGMFDDAARSAVAKWRFEPVQRDGAVVEQRTKMRLRFNAPN